MQYDQVERAYDPQDIVVNDVRQTHVSTSLSEIEDGMQGLLEAIRELEQRLGDVLRPSVDGPEKAMSLPREALVPLAERLTSHSGAVRLARQNVVNILDRLEL